MAPTTNGSSTLRYMFTAITTIGTSFAEYMHACIAYTACTCRHVSLYRDGGPEIAMKHALHALHAARLLFVDIVTNRMKIIFAERLPGCTAGGRKSGEKNPTRQIRPIQRANCVSRFARLACASSEQAR